MGCPGKKEYPDGATYEGGWKEGRKHGEGVLTEADGTVTEGEWVDGELKE